MQGFRFSDFKLSASLVVFLVLGGSSQPALGARPILYAISALIISIALYQNAKKPSGRLGWLIPALIGSVIAVGILQSIPLPPSLWQSLPGRDVIAESFTAIDEPLPWMPFSMSPQKTRLALLAFLPPCAVFLYVRNLALSREIRTARWAIILTAVLSVFLGLAQTLTSADSLYFYSLTNEGYPVGFFANANHQATFLLVGLALAVSEIFRWSGEGNTGIIATLASIILIGGLMVNGSQAGYLLTLILIGIAFFAFVLSRGQKRSDSRGPLYTFLVFICVVPVVAFILVDIVFTTQMVDEILLKLSAVGEFSRVNVYSDASDIAVSYLPFGTGLGTFPEIFRLYEDGSSVSNTYLPYAHNDYLELIVEFGLLAPLWMAAFFVWMLDRAIIALRQKNNGHQFWTMIGALLALTAIVLHSVVDYPLRTISVAVLFAFAIALLERASGSKRLG